MPKIRKTKDYFQQQTINIEINRMRIYKRESLEVLKIFIIPELAHIIHQYSGWDDIIEQYYNTKKLYESRILSLMNDMNDVLVYEQYNGFRDNKFRNYRWSYWYRYDLDHDINLCFDLSEAECDETENIHDKIDRCKMAVLEENRIILDDLVVRVPIYTKYEGTLFDEED